MTEKLWETSNSSFPNQFSSLPQLPTGEHKSLLSLPAPATTTSSRQQLQKTHESNLPKIEEQQNNKYNSAPTALFALSEPVLTPPLFSSAAARKSTMGTKTRQKESGIDTRLEEPSRVCWILNFNFGSSISSERSAWKEYSGFSLRLPSDDKVRRRWSNGC